MKTLFDEFLRYVEEEFGHTISLVESEKTDNFETFFETSFFPVDASVVMIDASGLDDFALEYSGGTNDGERKMLLHDEDMVNICSNCTSIKESESYRLIAA